MLRLFQLLETVSRSNSTILITGETGTGKEVVARAIHHNSARRAHRFVALNCSAIPEPLLEAELFGHVRGAFTGAVGAREWIRSQLKSKGPAWAETRHARCRVRGASEPLSAMLAEPDSGGTPGAAAGPCGSQGKSVVRVEPRRASSTAVPPVATILEGIMNEARRILQDRDRLCQVA
jgi:hypothetical protein